MHRIGWSAGWVCIMSPRALSAFGFIRLDYNSSSSSSSNNDNNNNDNAIASCLYKDVHGLYFLGGWVAPRESSPQGRQSQAKRGRAVRTAQVLQCTASNQRTAGTWLDYITHPGPRTCSVDAGSCILQDGRSLFLLLLLFLSLCSLTPFSFICGCAAFAHWFTAVLLL